MTASEQATDWIELVLSMQCNLRCRACPATHQASSETMSSRQIAGWLRRGREQGASGVWFGGGEPTLHPRLLGAVRRARQLGYSRVRLQSNGLRLAYPEFCERLVQAGVTEVAVPLVGADAAAYDAYTRHEGSFELLDRALENLRQLELPVEGDVLISAQSTDRLAETVQRFAAPGLRRFTFWLVSLHGLDRRRHGHFVPPMARLVPRLQRALDSAEALGVPASTLHTPPCVLTRPYRRWYQHSGSWNLLVVTPDGRSFRAELSPMEGGVYLPGCPRCSWRSRCLGLRDDYLELFGPEGFEPLP